MTGEWPGYACSDSETNGYGEQVFTISVPAGAQGVVLSNGNGAQTTDITNFDVEGYYTDGTKDGEKFIAIPWPGDVPGPGPGPGPDPIPGSSFKFTDNQKWGTVYVYAYGENGPMTGEWPGYACSDSETNGLGETVFTITVPAGAQGIVLSNGNGAQTTDITDFSAEGYYTDGTKDGEKFIAIPWPGSLPENPPENPGGENPPYNPPVSGGSSFKFTDNQGWGTVYVYAFDDNGAVGGEWPGTVCTDSETNGLGETVFTINVPDGATGIVLSNGIDDQTVNITDFSVEGYYTDGTKDGEENYNVIPWPGSLPENNENPGGGTPGGNTGSFLFTNNAGWGACYVYAFNGDGPIGAAWPGNTMAEKTTNGYGEEQFIINVPAGATGLVLNNGNGDQTVDITNFNVQGYYTNGGRDVSGHLNVLSW